MSVPLVVLSGPTASGKSQLAVDVALECMANGRAAEVVNADSMLVYQGMDIGTAKPTLEERRGVRHHLIDIYDPSVSASVSQFQKLARSTIAQIRQRGAVAILVGGSALYTRAITDVFEFPPTNAQVRRIWELELERVGVDALYETLAGRAPDVAGRIHPGNARRIVRALEAIDLTGDFAPTLPSWTYHLDHVLSFGLTLERTYMDERIAWRATQMWETGLVEEVESLLANGVTFGVTAAQALGYAQVLAYLNGELTRDEACEQTIARTKRFARKQLQWLRRDGRIESIDATFPQNAGHIVEQIFAGIGSQ